MKRSHVLVVASLLVAASAALTGCPGHHRHRFRVEVTPAPAAHRVMVAIAHPDQLPAVLAPAS